MQMIFTILRATHCRSTHHYFAIDALKQLPTASAQRLGQLLLKYHDEYLDGAKSPDTRFKDSQNHVIHVSDNNWGGAAQKCQEWREVALKHLNERRWKKAAYACGVLSHYFTDPLMPLHTAQSPKESSIHRPMEWSVFKSYDEIFSLSKQQQSTAQFQFSSDRNWIGKAVLALAQISHQHFDQLINNFQLTSANDPPNFGLNEHSRRSFASLFTLAIDGWSAVLSRLADETSAELPQVSLRLTTLLAAIDMPLAWLVRRMSDSGQRRAVAAAIREFAQTGNFRIQDIAIEGSMPGSLHQSVTATDAIPDATIEQPPNSPAIFQFRDQSDPHSESQRAIPQFRDQSDPHSESQRAIPQFEQPVFVSLAEARARMKGLSPVVGHVNSVSLESSQQSKSPSPSLYRARQENTVNLNSPLIQSPSIGPKTAKRFEKIGVRTIGQFLAENPDELESRLQTRWITAAVIGQWQDQSRLVCEVPLLSGYQAQLLVSIGCRTAWQLRTANPNSLGNQLSHFCQTSEGQHILQSAPTPTSSDVDAWIESARNHARRKAA